MRRYVCCIVMVYDSGDRANALTRGAVRLNAPLHFSLGIRIDSLDDGRKAESSKESDTEEGSEAHFL